MIREVEVKTIWSEMVKPWDPTPSHLKTMRLSVLDQLATPFHVPTLLFYSAPELSIHANQLVDMMKTSLSKAISQFYPLAGRLQDDSTLICDDQGALLIYTQVTCPLKSYFSSIVSSFHSYDQKPLVHKLLPPRDLLHGSNQLRPLPISAWVQLAFQVNVFQCGGIVIGCSMSHKVMDGISAATFVTHWAGLCAGMSPPSKQLVLPNFGAIVDAFPPYETTKLGDERIEDALQMTTPTTSTVMVKAFVFKPTDISSIRKKAVSDRIPNPTRIESVVGFLWKNCLEAEANVGPTNLMLTVDMRSRSCPSLPWESMGNLATNVVARAEKTGLELKDLVVEIRGAINEFEDEEMLKFQGEKGGKALWEHKNMITQETSGNEFSTYIVSCQCRSGFSYLDFGFGKPNWMYPFVGVTPSKPNHRFIILVDHIDPTNGNGIEAWLILDKKQMQRLDTNPDFLAFASPLVVPEDVTTRVN